MPTQTSPRRPAPAPRRGRALRPSLDALEARIVLSVPPGGGPVDLDAFYEWTGNGDNDFWDNRLNWRFDGGTATSAPGAGSRVEIIGAVETIQVRTAVVVGSLEVEGSTIDIAGGSSLAITPLSTSQASELAGATIGGAGSFSIAATDKVVTVSEDTTVNAPFSNDGILTLATGATLTVGTELANEGSLTVPAGTMLTGEGTLANSGIFTLAGTASVGSFEQVAGTTTIAGGALATTSTIDGGVLQGAGTTGPLAVGTDPMATAVVRPGGLGAIGTLSVQGQYTQGAYGNLEVELAGSLPTQQDQLFSSTTAAVGGKLKALAIGGFTPTAANSFVPVLAGGQRTGTFSMVEATFGSLSFAPLYQDKSVVLATSQEVTSQVSIAYTGFSYIRRTGRFTQQLTIKNTGATPLAGPLSVLLQGLPEGVLLHNKTGLSTLYSPTSPYIDFSPLAPGEDVRVLLEFANPSLVNISYTVRIIAGEGAR